jgi:hypothetical protein
LELEQLNAPRLSTTRIEFLQPPASPRLPPRKLEEPDFENESDYYLSLIPQYSDGSMNRHEASMASNMTIPVEEYPSFAPGVRQKLDVLLSTEQNSDEIAQATCVLM